MVELNVVHDLESEGEIPKVDMDSQKPDDAEIAKHPVERALSIFTHDVTGTSQVKNLLRSMIYPSPQTYAISSGDFPSR